jgi:hypothetical protein
VTHRTLDDAPAVQRTIVEAVAGWLEPAPAAHAQP